ncbi:hypothetical protein J6Z39_08295 [bacterium]|nr:hypothetical protein [bacterium]
MRKPLIRLIFFAWIVSADLFAAAPLSALKVCLEKDGAPFVVSTTNAAEAEKNGYKRVGDRDIYIRNFKVLVDGVDHTKFGPISKDPNCILVRSITGGRHTVSIDFKSIEYTNLETTKPYTTNFKQGLLHDGTITIGEGDVARVDIKQTAGLVEIFQSIDNKLIENCEKSCNVPTGIPIYFKQKAVDSKILCPTSYQLILPDESEKGKSCYAPEIISQKINEYVRENDVMCRLNIEEAFFRVYGEGCMLTLAANADGLGIEPPLIRMVPLARQKIQYRMKFGEGKSMVYTFSADGKGPERTPVKGEIIEFIEERM